MPARKSDAIPNAANDSAQTGSWSQDTQRRYDEFAARLSRRGQLAIQKHDGDGGDEAHIMLWKIFAGTLGQLASHAIETTGQLLVKFYIADGQYRRQVFALQDLKTALAIHLPDVLDEAIRRKMLRKTGEENTYEIVGVRGARIQLELIAAHLGEENPCKGMLGWGRRALRAQVGAKSSDCEVRMLERLCVLAAETWSRPAQA